jgi:hypothetical protein
MAGPAGWMAGLLATDWSRAPTNNQFHSRSKVLQRTASRPSLSPRRRRRRATCCWCGDARASKINIYSLRCPCASEIVAKHSLAIAPGWISASIASQKCVVRGFGAICGTQTKLALRYARAPHPLVLVHYSWHCVQLVG